MNDTPPTLIEPIGVLMQILKRHSEKNRRKPKMMPGTTREAAQYWIDHQEPPNDFKEAVTENFKNGVLTGYDTPYHDRLARTLRSFLWLKAVHQAYVIDAAERKIWWRGDDMDMFPMIVKETDEMLKDPAAYDAKHGNVHGVVHE